jgi:hypothetical protein
MGDSSIMGVAVVLAGQVQVGVPTPKSWHSMKHYCLVHYTITWSNEATNFFNDTSKFYYYWTLYPLCLDFFIQSY